MTNQIPPIRLLSVSLDETEENGIRVVWQWNSGALSMGPRVETWADLEKTVENQGFPVAEVRVTLEQRKSLGG